ncbi:MAG: hypothetical protein U0401_08065 [Anaerolineae bacterium]
MKNEPLSGQPDPHHLPVIRASELAQFSFCRRAWWLATVKGNQPKNQAALSRGVFTHNRHFQHVQTAQRWRYASVFLLSGGGLLLLAILLWQLLIPYF